MSDESQDVAISVVPSLLPSCFPSSSSGVHEIPVPENSDPNTNCFVPNNCSSGICHQNDASNGTALHQEEVSVAHVTSPQSPKDFSVAIDSDHPNCDICAEAECFHLINKNTNQGKVELLTEDHDNVTKVCEYNEQVSIDDEPYGIIPKSVANLEETDHIGNCRESVSNEAISASGYTDQALTVQSESSTSTDGTLRNSEESCESDTPIVLTDIIFTNSKLKSNETIMGNKQSGGKQGRGENERDGRTKCCEIPKKKLKDRTNRSNRTSRHDDLAFDSAEVYPFDGRAVSEHELHEPVELEPFEIVETDDIKFVPGAGTSEVIKSISEPKFSTIPEEASAAEFATTSNENQDTMKVPFYIEKGNRLIEPGTSTAHSTFEFKQVKQKTKLVKMTPDPYDHNYENVQLTTDKDVGVSGLNSERKVSNSSSKSSSSSSSKDISRNNSKDAKQKPIRKGKSKASDNVDNSASASSITEIPNTSAGDVKRKQPKGNKKEPAIRDSEIDRKIDSVLMLTQTMFSQTKPPEKSDDQAKCKDITQTLPGLQYENVGVVAKMESTGIKIVHQEVPIKPTKEGCENKNTNLTQCTGGNNCENPNAPRETAESSRQKNYPQLSSDILEISESGTLIIKSLADLPSERPDIDDEVPDNSFSNDDVSDKDTDQTDTKTSFETFDNETEKEDIKVTYESVDERYNDTNGKVTYESIDRLRVNEIIDVSKSPVELEEVPPPSPLAMDALAEVEEDDEEEYDDDDDYIEDTRQSAEIVEFTENVCKRLSQLLVLEGHREEESENDDSKGDTCSEEKKFADHIYETIDGNSKLVGGTVDGIEPQTEIHKEVDNESLNNSLKLSTKSGSTGTLKRTSGDSETYQRQEMKDSVSSESSDDMPSYFDPSQHSLSHTHSEVLGSVLDSYDGDHAHEEKVSGDNASKTIKSNKTNFEGGSYDNVTLESEGNVISEPLKSFGLDLINAAPSTNKTEDLLDRTPTAEAQPNLTALMELANVEVETPLQYDTSGRHSVTCTESDLDISEHRDDLSTDSMLADDEAEETMEILFTKTYTEPVEGAEVFLSCTVVNSAYKEEQQKSETWLSDEALEYFEANASEVMSTAFLKAKKEMKDIQICLQSLRQQMDHFHSDCDDISLPEIPVDSLSPDYFGIPHRKAITD